MKSYSEIVNKQFKVNKKGYVLTVVGIMLTVILLTLVMIFFKYSKERNIEFYKVQNGDYHVAYEIQKEDFDEKIDILKNNTLIRNYSLVSKEIYEDLDLKGNLVKLNLAKLDENSINEKFSKALKSSLKEGKLPTEKNEIIIDNNIKELGYGLGENIIIDNNNYKIVGIFNNIKYDGTAEVKAITTYSLEEKNSVTAYSSLDGNRKTIISNINKLTKILGYSKDKDDNSLKDIPLVIYNRTLIEEIYQVSTFGQGFGLTMGFLKVLSIMAVMILAISTISTLIKINMVDRIKVFGILRCIGADSKQIRRLVYKEIFSIAIMAILPAITIGYTLAFIIFNFILKSEYFNNYGINLTFYPIEITKVILVTLITIFLATLKPAKDAGEIMPIEAVKSRKGNGKKLKGRKSKVIRKFFGIEGEIAYKNLRANSGIFYTGTILIIISFLIFITFNTFIKAYISQFEIKADGIKEFSLDLNTFLQYEEENLENKDENYWNDYREKLNLKGEKESNELKKLLEKNSVAKEIAIALTLSNQMDIVINNRDGIEEKVKESPWNTFDQFKEFNNGNKKDILLRNSFVLVYNDEAFNMIKGKIKGEQKDLKDFEKNGLIVIDTIGINKDRSSFVEPAFSITSGENVKIQFGDYKDELDNFDGKSYDMKILGSIEPTNLLKPIISELETGFIISEEFYKENFADIKDNGGIDSREFYFNFINEEAKNNNLSKLESELKLNFPNSYLRNEYEEIKAVKEILKIIKICTYSLLIFIVVILITAIFISKKATINSRKKDYGTMLALGMDRKSLKRTIFLEGLIQWLIVILIAVPLSIFIGDKVLNIVSIYTDSLMGKIEFDYLLLIGTTIFSFFIIMIANTVPFRKFKGLATVDMIKEEE